ncbi:MAG: hypothetical protein K9L74_07730 [Candidatus Izimaplasma sp.]|nr:hypothetical protein [Candidatus Izimaplasma bacterium]
MTYFLSEQSIIQEADVVYEKPQKSVFRMAVQSADDENKNKRIYPYSTLNEAIKNCMPQVKSRSFYGETDHPIPSGNSDFDEIRQTTVLLKESSHIITDFEWRGKILWAQFETLSNRHGKDLVCLLRDRTRIGSSMRGLAELERKNGMSVVQSPLIIITYDVVSSPSHQIARVDEREVTFESLTKMNSKYIVNESMSGIREKDSGLICTSDGVCYLPNYFDRLVETNIINFAKKWV